MATAISPFASTKETTNYARLCRLLVDVGSQVLRSTFDTIHPPATLHTVLGSTSVHYAKLQSLYKGRKKVLNPTQWGKLYPPHKAVSSKDFDITLLTVLLRNICSLRIPFKGWDELPPATDIRTEDDIARVKYYRNTVYAHAPQASVDDSSFSAYWQEIREALVRLGGAHFRAKIDNLEHDCMDPVIEEHYRELMKQWKKEDDSIKDKLEEIGDLLENMRSILERNFRDATDKREIDMKEVKEKLTCLTASAEKSTQEDSLSDLRDTTEKIEIEKKEVKETLSSLTTTVEKTTDEGIFDSTELINGIRQLYKTREGWLSPFPWCEEFQFFLGNIFTRLKVVRRKKTRGEITDVFVDMSSILDPYEECSAPRTVLIEGEPGMGKTTYCKKYAYDWATKQQEPQGCGSTAFKVVLLLKCRDIHSDVWEAIDDQLLPRDIDEEIKQQFFRFIRENQSSILLILDGLDELPSSKLSMFSELIEGRVLPRCHIVATARHEAGKEVRKCCDALLQIEGFTEKHVRGFVIKYFKERPDLATKLSQRMSRDKNLREIAANPLNTALLCLLCEEFEGTLPESRAQLYLDMVECVLRRYRKKKGLSEKIEDLTNHYKPQLNHLGKVALNGLLDDKLDFNESELKNHAKDLTEFGFLSVQRGGSKLRQTLHYAFLHKSFQEFFAAFFICSQVQSKEMKPEELVSDPKYFLELKQILLFSCGILAMKCDEQVVALVKSLTNEVNKNKGRGAKIVLEAINECKREKSDFHSHLSKSFGTGLNLTNLDLRDNGISAAGATCIAEAIKVNKTLTNLDLRDNGISAAGATCIAEAIKVNKTLTNLYLCGNGISAAGATCIAEAMKVNKTLTNLDLSWNGISDAGATCIAEAMKVNKTLTNLDLSWNDISDAGATCIAEAMKVNKTLTNLYLCGNGIRDVGATCIAEAMKVNKTLTNLDLSFSDISAAGATCIAEAMKVNKMLTNLDLSGNGISDAGATCIAEAIKVNKTLTNLDLIFSGIRDVGTTCIAEAMKVNKTLTNLYLSGNGISDAGATCIAEAMKVNKTLTNLDLSFSGISAAGAACIAEAIKVNKTLTNLHLIFIINSAAGATCIAEAIKVNKTLTNLDLRDNGISAAGATCIAEAIKVNKTLTNLDLRRNGISDADATCIAEAMKVNKTLTNLDLSWNGISDAGATCIAEAMKVNKTLTNLDLSGNGISDAGATCIAEAIKVNKTLTNLDLSWNGISAAGATCIAEAMKVNKTLTNLYLSDNSISDAGATCIAEAIKVNKTLTNFDLSYYGMSC
ncbi:NLR family CARD domain-containing protein 3-like isoform X2 [Pocillopora verrucosa]|uniref:NLR family CARD domain-containing protein 3-like isoform X2 n=1 Tax=Pocillopora verrucosa TaxID=203993 RepID=UPI003340B115